MLAIHCSYTNRVMVAKKSQPEGWQYDTNKLEEELLLRFKLYTKRMQ